LSVNADNTLRAFIVRFDSSLNLLEAKALENTLSTDQFLQIRNVEYNAGKLYFFGGYSDAPESVANGALIITDIGLSIESIISYPRMNFMSVPEMLSDYNTVSDLIVTSDNHIMMVGTDVLGPLEASHVIKAELDGTGDAICYYHVNGFKLNDIVFTNENFASNVVKSLVYINGTPTYTDALHQENGCCSFDLGLNTDYCINPGQTITLCAPSGYDVYVWNGTAGSSCYNVNTPGVYELEVVDANGCVSHTFFNVQYPDFSSTTITGPSNKCTTPQTYNVVGAPAGSTYSWSTTGGTFSSTTSNPTSITWSTATSASTVTCIVTTPVGCSKKISFIAVPCCEPITTIDCQVIETSYSETPTTLSSLIATYNSLGCSDIPDSTISGVTYAYFTGLEIEVNSELIIDVNVCFDICTFLISPNQKITINPGIEVLSRRSVFKEKCNYMWDGVYLTSSTSKITLINSKFQQALNALVSNNGGQYYISSTSFGQSEFKNCNVGILVNNHPGANPSTVSGTIFHKPGTFLPPLSMFVRGKAGILIEGNNITPISSLVIGDASSDEKRNEFKNITYGIANKYYNLTCYNNKFTSIIAGTAIPGMGVGTACIASVADKIKPIIVNVINPSTTFINDFKNSTYGVHAYNYVTLKAIQNTFKQVNFAIKGVSLTPGLPLHQIEQNTIKDFSIGIELRENSKRNYSVKNNTLNFGGILPPSLGGIGNVGIFFNDVVGTAYKAKIEKNNINNIRTGIWLKNSLSADLANPILVNDNDIVFAAGISPSSTNVY